MSRSQTTWTWLNLARNFHRFFSNGVYPPWWWKRRGAAAKREKPLCGEKRARPSPDRRRSANCMWCAAAAAPKEVGAPFLAVGWWGGQASVRQRSTTRASHTNQNVCLFFFLFSCNYRHSPVFFQRYPTTSCFTQIFFVSHNTRLAGKTVRGGWDEIVWPPTVQYKAINQTHKTDQVEMMTHIVIDGHTTTSECTVAAASRKLTTTLFFDWTVLFATPNWPVVPCFVSPRYV